MLTHEIDIFILGIVNLYIFACVGKREYVLRMFESESSVII